MSINDISQKINLINKIGLGVPQMSSNIRISQQTQPQPQPQQPPQSPKPQQPQPQQPVKPAPSKPGCGGCRRKRAS